MRKLGSVLALLLTAAASPSAAAVARFDYVATSASGTLTGTFGWDLAVTDGNPVSFIGSYFGAGFINGTITGGPQDGGAFSLSGLWVQVQNSPAPYAIGYLGTSTAVFLSGAANALGDVLPTHLDLSQFGTFAQIWVSSADAGVAGRQQFYNVTSITTVPAPIPLPATLPLLAAGVGALAFLRRRTAPAC